MGGRAQPLDVCFCREITASPRRLAPYLSPRRPLISHLSDHLLWRFSSAVSVLSLSCLCGAIWGMPFFLGYFRCESLVVLLFPSVFLHSFSLRLFSLFPFLFLFPSTFPTSSSLSFFSSPFHLALPLLLPPPPSFSLPFFPSPFQLPLPLLLPPPFPSFFLSFQKRNITHQILVKPNFIINFKYLRARHRKSTRKNIFDSPITIKYISFNVIPARHTSLLLF